MNLTISIGRNVGDTPLGIADWRDFRDDVHLIACQISDAFPPAQIVQTGFVDGWWDGAHEESYTITIANVNASRRYKSAVHAQLSTLCARYEQDAIAATWYRPSFVN